MWKASGYSRLKLNSSCIFFQSSLFFTLFFFKLSAFLQSTDSPGSCSTGSDSPMSVQSPPTPVPHTPLFSPSSNHSQNSPSSSSSAMDGVMDSSSQDLPQELYKTGWRRFWSDREGRFYFFNKFTQESRWDLMSIQKVAQENTNRRQSSSSSIVGAAPAVQMYKNYVPSNEWNVHLPTNVKMCERVPFCFYPPHPEMEILRINSVLKLRQYLIELCQTKEGKPEKSLLL